MNKKVANLHHNLFGKIMLSGYSESLNVMNSMFDILHNFLK